MRNFPIGLPARHRQAAEGAAQQKEVIALNELVKSDGDEDDKTCEG